MKLLRATKSALLSCIAASQLLGIGLSQVMSGKPMAAASVAVTQPAVDEARPSRAFPRVHLWGSHELTYVGMFSPDAVFRAASKLLPPSGRSPGEGILPASSLERVAGQSEVPAWMLLSNERVVQNLAPPLHARCVAQAPSTVAITRNRFLTYAYGRPSVLSAPHHVATDSRQRLIVSDSAGNSVHVLDPKGKTSFRIASGEGHRLQHPSGVAADADDNIYVADSAIGMVLQFDPYGNFVHYLGDYQGEPEFTSPGGIAIDRKRGRLFVVDSPRSLLFMLDLNGKVLKTIGRLRTGAGVTVFDYPSEVAVSGDRVFVLDASGSRIQILDTECNLMGSFSIPHGSDPLIGRENGLSADQQGNLYVSSIYGSVIRAFSPDGRLLATFGQSGLRVGEFEGPTGLWIDSANRLYVADSGNGRVQMFQLSTQQ